MKRIRIKLAGMSGSGLLSTGEIFTRALNNLGFNIAADREYPSVIKGGHACYTLNISSDKIYGLSQEADIMVGIDKQGLEAFYHELKAGGTLVHGYDRERGLKKITESVLEQGGEVYGAPSRAMSAEQGGNLLMTNVVILGLLWKILGLDYAVIEAEVTEQFKSKPKLLEIDLRCLQAGFDATETKHPIELPAKPTNEKLIINGNKAITLGAIHAGCRAYYAYPMSPASSILTYMADMAKETKMIVKQVEDEISVAQMTIGSSFAGTRSMCATAGGGFDLMAETVSLAGMIETPFVCIIAQRPGPATGLPTWTSQTDLNIAIHSGHGEFPRIVIGVSDVDDAFTLIQHAFNLAEAYQGPVIVLTEKAIAEGLWSTKPFEQNTIPIERNLATGELENSDRYKITDSGLSKRWAPGSNDAYYFANGDEHWEDGTLTEDGDKAKAMISKRLRKMDGILSALPEPDIYGSETAKISFIGWGSSRNVMRDIIAENPDVNYLHFSYVWPIKTEKLKAFITANPNVHLIEESHVGQFGQHLEAAVGPIFKNKLLKWNGRSIFLEEVRDYITQNS
jgi:2-oxoglutarate ferredoxin oxidoreductase subunit alpha